MPRGAMWRRRIEEQIKILETNIAKNREQRSQLEEELKLKSTELQVCMSAGGGSGAESRGKLTNSLARCSISKLKQRGLSAKRGESCSSRHPSPQQRARAHARHPLACWRLSFGAAALLSIMAPDPPTQARRGTAAGRTKLGGVGPGRAACAFGRSLQRTR